MQVLATDTYGNALVSGGQASLVSVELASGEAVAFSVVDNNDGTYTVSYQPPDNFSSFRLKVQIDGVPVVGSPFSVRSCVLVVHGARAHPMYCHAQVTVYRNRTIPRGLIITSQVVGISSTNQATGFLIFV
jgi:hypothetical protein